MWRAMATPPRGATSSSPASPAADECGQNTFKIRYSLVGQSTLKNGHNIVKTRRCQKKGRRSRRSRKALFNRSRWKEPHMQHSPPSIPWHVAIRRQQARFRLDDEADVDSRELSLQRLHRSRRLSYVTQQQTRLPLHYLPHVH